MDLSDDTNKRSLFDDNDAPLNSLVAPSDHDQSDSEDDFALNSMVDQDALDNYNIPSNLKNILRMDDHDINLNDSFRDDSESDDDSFINRRFEASVDINKINEEIEKNKSKFMNFPLMPPTEEEKEPKMTVKRPKKPREKKKRREKKDVFEAQREARANKLHQLLKGLREENESEEEEEKENNKSKRKMGRRTRKKESNEIKVDENGERLIRTTELLDDTSEEEEDEGEERKLSKRAELEMYREAERRRRAANVMLKPVYNIKSFDDFVKRRDEHEQAYLRKLELERQHKTVSSHIPNKHEESDDSDLEIIGDPKRIAASLLSPDRVRYPIPNFSPIRHASIALREHNRRMLNRITNEGYDHRIKMEEEAKARGYFASATERAKRLLEKEKNALMIKEQVDMHFEMKKGPKNYNNSSEDEDESYEANDDIFDEFSGSEEEFDIDYVDDVKKNSLKRKVDSNDEDGDENDMATIAFRRWKGKKAKKSIFDDDDEDEDENENSSAKKKAAQKPEPAHSIVNFFKAKEAKNKEIKEANEDEREEKPLTRLVRRNSNDDTVDDTKEEMQTDDLNAMDIDEISAPVKKLQKATLSSKPEGNNEYLEEEAEEEEDEYFGVAGSDEEIGENLDEFEDDGLLVENNDEYVDEAVLREAFIQQDKESDSNLIQRLITDIAGGGLRRQKAAAEAGLMLDDIDLYDGEDNDLIAIRRAAEARRRKLLKQKGENILENLLNDPKTAAFAKAAQAIPDESVIAFLSENEEDEDEDEDDDENEDLMISKNKNRIIIEEEEDDVQQIQNILDHNEDKVDLMDDISDDENFVIVDGFKTKGSSLPGGVINNAS